MNRTKAQIVIFAEASKRIKMLSETLASTGHTVTVADDPETVLCKLKSERRNVLIADIGGNRGADAGTLNSVRAEFPDLPIICISGSAESAGGVADHEILITKPYRISHIEQCINQLLQTSALPNERKSNDFILVVDDDDMFRTLLVRSLRLFGYAAREARDGREAIEIIEKGGVFAVIADIQMPGIDGVTLMRKIKSQTPDVPVILVTGYYVSNEWPAGSDVSPDGFLMKPFKMQHIDGLLENVLRKKTRS